MTFITTLSIISPLFVLVAGWRQRFTLLWLYAAIGLINDLSGSFLIAYKYDHHWTGNVFVLLEFFFITLYYRKYIIQDRIIFFVITLGGSLFFICNTILNSVLDFNAFGAGVLCVIYIIYGLLGFYRLLQQPEIIYLSKSPLFLINVAFFLYSCASSLLLLFGPYLRENNFGLMVTIWGTFFISINIFRYLLIGIALYKTPKK